MISTLSRSNKKILTNPITESLKVESRDKDYIFELGFIALFANFESLMYQLIKDLISKYPKSISSSDKTIKISDIISISSSKKIKEYIIDDIAIEHSTGIDKWTRYLDERFNIKTFPDKEFEKGLSMLNEIRNLYLHSGGITNSLFIKNMKKYIKSIVPMNQNVSFINREKNFLNLYNIFTKLVLHLQSQ
jgi:hypothetical protein